jgi:hypothetical protein
MLRKIGSEVSDVLRKYEDGVAVGGNLKQPKK